MINKTYLCDLCKIPYLPHNDGLHGIVWEYKEFFTEYDAEKANYHLCDNCLQSASEMYGRLQLDQLVSTNIVLHDQLEENCSGTPWPMHIEPGSGTMPNFEIEPGSGNLSELLNSDYLQPIREACRVIEQLDSICDFTIPFSHH